MTLQRLVDETEIRRLLLTFAASLDARDWTAYADTFLADGSFEILGQSRVGREAIAAGPQRDLTRFERTQHYVTGEVIEVEDDEATVRAQLLAVHVPDLASPDVHADVGGIYHCRCRRTPEGWRFSSVRLEIVWSAGLELGIRQDAASNSSLM